MNRIVRRGWLVAACFIVSTFASAQIVVAPINGTTVTPDTMAASLLGAILGETRSADVEQTCRLVIARTLERATKWLLANTDGSWSAAWSTSCSSR